MGMRVEQGTQVLTATPRVGQGKDTFFQAILEYLQCSSENPGGVYAQILDPYSGNLVTRNTWGLIRSMYAFAGHEGPFQKVYGAIRKNSNTMKGGGAVERFANSELNRIVEKSGLPFFTIHGLMGKGLPLRFFSEGDIWPEPLAADKKTIAYVTTEQTARDMEKFGKNKELVVAGFIVPKAVKDPKRVLERIDKFQNPDKSHPINVGYFITGQYSPVHMQILHEQILPSMQGMIKDGDARLNVYLWKSRKLAYEVCNHAADMNLNTAVGDVFEPHFYDGVNIFYNEDPDLAVRGSFEIARDTDFIVTPTGERISWYGYMPGVGLPPVRGNGKMEANYAWLHEQGLIPDIRDGYDMQKILSAYTANNGQRVKDHFECARDAFGKDYEYMDGAKKMGDRLIYEATKSK